MDLSNNWNSAGNFLFNCPGCDFLHVVSVANSINHLSTRPSWKWDGDVQRPTFNPSILVTIPAYENIPAVRCHSFIRAGQIEFLSDCSHHLAGQSVPLEPFAKGEI